MKPFVVWAKHLVLTVLISVLSSAHLHADDSIEKAGDALVYLLPATAGGMTIARKDGGGALQLMESIAVALGTTFALKHVIREERPNRHDHFSFPSAHSAASFSTSEFLRKRYSWRCGIPAYSVAAFVAASRVHADQHHVHDIMAGAAIGIVASYVITSHYGQWRVQAEVGGSYYGLGVSRSW